MPIYVSPSLCICVSMCVGVCLSVQLTINQHSLTTLCVYLCFHFSVRHFISLSFYLLNFTFLCLSVYPYNRLPIHCLSVHFSISMSVFFSISLSEIGWLAGSLAGIEIVHLMRVSETRKFKIVRIDSCITL